MKKLDLTELVKDERFINYCFQRNEADVRFWEDWLMRHPESADEIAALKDELSVLAKASAEKLKQDHLMELKSRISSSVKKGIRRRLWSRLAIAGSVALLVSIGGYYLYQKQLSPKQLTAQNVNQLIQPGGNKAVLTLSTGKNIILADAGNGNIAQEGEMAVKKTADGKIMYSRLAGGVVNNADGKVKVVMNTITTPRGGQWFVSLSDGTKVWLNAASSITYPVVFKGKERTVSITGEAYFEVVHNSQSPFKIKVHNLQIEDLGTAFNVNAYGDEPSIKTTLVEGSVKVSKNEKAKILKPGQQAVVSNGSDGIQIKKVAVQDIIGWKNGRILFENENLGTIMRQVSRWYDVNVNYTGDIPNRLFTGGISRKSNLSDFLKILEFEDVHFTVEGKKITIHP